MTAPVSVHPLSVDMGRPVSDADRWWLDEEERARLDGFGSEQAARRYAASHAHLRRVVAAHLGVERGAVRYDRSCEHCGHPTHGRPRLHDGPPGVEISLSHSGPVALVAVGPGPLGVDVEDLARRPVSSGVVARLATGSELARLPADGDPSRHRAVLQLWTAKEAVAKAVGLGLVLPFASFEVLGEEGAVVVPGSGTVLATHPVPVPGAVAAVAVAPEVSVVVGALAAAP